MYNWSVDEEQMKKADPEGYKIWRLEQMINWGLGGEKLKEKLVRKYWSKLFMDESTRRYLEFLLWDKFPNKLHDSKFKWHRVCCLCNFLRTQMGTYQY